MKSELLCGVAALVAAVGVGVSAGHSVINVQASPDAPPSSTTEPSPSPAPATHEPDAGGNYNPGADGGGGGGGGGGG
jgi:hypothetical protein